MNATAQLIGQTELLAAQEGQRGILVSDVIAKLRQVVNLC